MKDFWDYLREYFASKQGLIGGASAALFTWLFGGWETGLQVLVYFMVADYVMGLLCGGKEKNLSSDIGFKGLKKKFTILIILSVAVMVDRLLGQGNIFRTLVIYFYVAIEGISIIENAARLGVPFPQQLKDILVQLKEGNRKEIKDNNINTGA